MGVVFALTFLVLNDKLEGLSNGQLVHMAIIQHIHRTPTVLTGLPPRGSKLAGEKPITYAYEAISEKATQHLAYDALTADGALVIVDPFSQAILAKVKRDGGTRKVVYPRAALQWPENK
ncbi:hypothetical protein L227DRAFT_617688 [Lentinus tigrinus ALCF2SS1-6]|uniref:Uncharacterized protein n=1 Tax=Lentinus tigrinus ALCF2SS1-6 TaxID=1328759 RepID=A0A5C2RN87_9APHY|nr:hypothetical protein L227DRAFT_617688 [Lentinus tigrinus ALCF2SS1-6]